MTTKPNGARQLDSISKMLITSAAALVVILGLRYIAQDLLAPILLATFLTILLTPLYRYFRNKGFSNKVSLVLMLVTFAVVLIGLIAFVTFSFIILQNTLSDYMAGFEQTIANISASLGLDRAVVESTTRSISPESLSRLASVLGNSLGSLTLYLVVVPTLAVLMLIQVDSIPDDVAKKLSEDNQALNKFSKFADSIIIYVTGRLKVNLITGGAFATVLLIFGVDFAILWGLLTVLLSFVPYIGIVLAAIPPTILAFIESGPITALIVVIAVIIINLVAENVMDPLIQGKSNKISTAAVVIAVIFWGWLLGPVGVILAAPLTVLLKLVLADYRETSWIALLIEGNYSSIPTKQARDSTSKVRGFLNRFTTSHAPKKKNKQ